MITLKYNLFHKDFTALEFRFEKIVLDYISTFEHEPSIVLQSRTPDAASLCPRHQADA